MTNSNENGPSFPGIKWVSFNCFFSFAQGNSYKLLYQKFFMGPYPNGPRSVSCDRAIRYSGFFWGGPFHRSDRWRFLRK